MTREARMKEVQMLDAARRKFMNFTQQQKEAELARLDDEIRQKVSRLAAAAAASIPSYVVSSQYSLSLVVYVTPLMLVSNQSSV